MHSQSPKWQDNQIIWNNSELLPDIDSNGFDGRWWKEKGDLTGESVGRGTTYFFRCGHSEFVLRHYLRGGLIGKILSDQYLFTSLENTRAWQEKDLLLHMKGLDLPVPTPAAARIVKHGFYYRADLITQKIANAQDVHHILLNAELSDDTWRKIGAIIARFHAHQIYHHDLNIHNIMLDDASKVWLIDFDKCGLKDGSDWQQKNIERLHRSLLKESAKFNGYRFTQQNWQNLLAGYQHK